MSGKRVAQTQHPPFSDTLEPSIKRDMARSSIKHKPPATAAASTLHTAKLAPSPPVVPVRQLAHELNSLLDGALRCLASARTSIEQSGSVARKDDIETALSRTNASMQHMTALLKRAMRCECDAAAQPAVTLFSTSDSLAVTIQHITDLLQAHLEAVFATLICRVAPECADHCAGPLGPVVMNGLRNALEACAQALPQQRRISLSVTCENQAMCLEIVSPAADKLPGQRLGLALSQQIVRELGGELALLAQGNAVTLRANVPAGSLLPHG